MTASPPAAFSMELCISTAGLETGMYVSRLDRPWKDAGFAVDGWFLRTGEEVARVRAACRHVHVDISRGKAPASSHVLLSVGEDADDAPAPGPDDPGEVRRDAQPAGEQGAPRRVLRWAPPGAGDGVLDGWASLAEVPPPVPAPFDAPVPSPAPSAAQRAARDAFGDELAAAQAAYAGLEAGIRQVLDSARAGEGIAGVSLQHGVDAMLDSLGRNAGALPWVAQMQRKGEYLYRHGVACSIWAATFGRHLGLERDALRELAIAALLCDVGKVHLPTELLLKPGPLHAGELRAVRAHVEGSARIVAGIDGLSADVARMVAQHHERHDGSGYPLQLRGAQILLGGRIVGLVDSYDAMTSDRGYAARRSPHEAMMELYQTRDRLFDGAVVEQFIRACGVYPTGTLVELSDGTVGVVMAVNALRRLRPVLMRILDEDKRLLADFAVVDLARVEIDAAGRPLSVRAGLPLGAYGLDAAMLFLD